MKKCMSILFEAGIRFGYLLKKRHSAAHAAKHVFDKTAGCRISCVQKTKINYVFQLGPMFEYQLGRKGRGLGGELRAVIEMRLGIDGAFLGEDPAAGRPETGLEPFNEVAGSPLYGCAAPHGGCSSNEKTQGHYRAAQRTTHAAAFPDAFGKGSGQGESLVFFQAPAQSVVECYQHGFRAVHLPTEEKVARTLADEHDHIDRFMYRGAHSKSPST
jgi:hypothetical protein